MPTEYHDALLKCGYRYRDMKLATYSEERFAVGDDLLPFINEFIDGCQSGMPVPKLCRWLGYIQGVLIERGLTTVTIERDWTRPLFRPLDFP